MEEGVALAVRLMLALRLAVAEAVEQEVPVEMQPAVEPVEQEGCHTAKIRVHPRILPTLILAEAAVVIQVPLFL